MLSGSRWGPGIMSFAPTSTEAKGRPQALTWNMGTTGRTQSRSESANVLPIATIMEWRTVERWE
jgi:hypothetical protein